MPQFAYLARNAAGTDAGLPSLWPFGWLYPDDATTSGYPTTPLAGGNIPGIPWPPGWPKAAAAATAIVTDCPATMSLATHTGTVECYLTVGGVQAAASVYANHLIQVSVTEAAASRSLRKSGGAAYVTAIFFKVTNYAGNKWGFSATVDFDPTFMTVADTFTVDGLLVTVIANADATDQFSVVS